MVTIAPVEHLLLAVYGAIKTAKTSLLLSMPKPLVVLDFDQSFDRAVGRLMAIEPDLAIVKVMPEEKLEPALLDQYDVIVRQYDMPLQAMRQRLHGFVTLWEDLVMPEFQMACNHTRVASIGLDTGTLFWNIDHQAQLERVQIIAEAKNSVRITLDPLEYARPNTDARGLLAQTRNKFKNFMAVHHVGPKYGPGWEEVQKGNRSEKVFRPKMLIGETWAGFSHIGEIVDIIARSRIENQCTTCNILFEPDPTTMMQHGTHTISVGDKTGLPVPHPTLTIEECGYSLNATGLKLNSPTYAGILNIVNAFRLGDNANHTG
jgi:hypothetical protein